jgi:hypothetical protein
MLPDKGRRKQGKAFHDARKNSPNPVSQAMYFPAVLFTIELFKAVPVNIVVIVV